MSRSRHSLIPLRIDGQPTRREVAHRRGWLGHALAFQGRDAQPGACGTWLMRCHSVVNLHRSVDIAFLGEDGTVIKVCAKVRPWEVVICRKASSALTLRRGLASRLGLRPGVPLDLHA